MKFGPQGGEILAQTCFSGLSLSHTKLLLCWKPKARRKSELLFGKLKTINKN